MQFHLRNKKFREKNKNGIINIDTGAFLPYYGEKGKLTVREM
jgi:hypothetical protein